ncbi:VOC family protein [Trichococcus collinsii]|uniref:Catechol-2,3-dioxygenase n=1 Tax=Trichococcus collinsii TaxID=157076 RepID=A0AB37ZY04_9LACT|nr:VOC family protein [Trichococcus collinsii]CZR09704.1 glyoxalase/bleomycin resistance protein/dihydroxybiphenyl dioxygenase [Trichococcus collinsii]SEA13401.1 Catechol-2,3-dioxygenase [Trichococcus collinsii]
MITGFHHLTAITKDAEKNKTFYTDILGLRLVKRTVNQDNLTDPHLFYGDYKGTPGTILTFFELPKVGHRHEEDSFIHEVLLKIPQGSLLFWEKRLTARAVRLIENDDEGCTFLDPDDMKISLVEVAEMIAANQATNHSEVPAEYQIIGIQGIHYTVSDVKKTEAFFHDVLGMLLTDHIAHPRSSPDEKSRLIQSTSQKPSRLGRGAIDHIAYNVPDRKDLEQILEKAKENNITVEKIINRGYFQSLYLREPSGLRIEIATDKPGFTLDEPLAELGETFALPDFLQPKRKAIESTILNRKK